MNPDFSRRAAVADTADRAGTVSYLALTPADPGGDMVSPGMLICTTLRIDGADYRVAHDIRALLRDTLRALLGGSLVFAGEMLTVAAQGVEISILDGLATVASRQDAAVSRRD